jgi:FixJ family two-component response regulator
MRPDRDVSNFSYDHDEAKAPFMVPQSLVFVVTHDLSIRKYLNFLTGAVGLQLEIFESAEQFLEMPRPLTSHCLVLDIHLPNLSGLDLQQRLADSRDDIPVIFITDHADVPMTVQAMKAGAIEFLIKPYCDDALLRAVRQALEMSGASLARQKQTRELMSRYKSLTERERRVMELVVAGQRNKLVADELGISEITVKAHRGNVMRKMKAQSLPDLVNMSALIFKSREGRVIDVCRVHAIHDSRFSQTRAVGPLPFKSQIGDRLG